MTYHFFFQKDPFNSPAVPTSQVHYIEKSEPDYEISKDFIKQFLFEKEERGQFYPPEETEHIEFFFHEPVVMTVQYFRLVNHTFLFRICFCERYPFLNGSYIRATHKVIDYAFNLNRCVPAKMGFSTKLKFIPSLDGYPCYLALPEETEI